VVVIDAIESLPVPEYQMMDEKGTFALIVVG
jgi:hypothetical protein